MSTKLTKKLYEEYSNKEMVLRVPSEQVINEYADALKAGAKFPPLTFGTYPPENEKDSGKLIVDGMNRSGAAHLTGMWEKFEVVFVKYATKALALADQLKRNMEHGWRVTVSDRNARIVQLHELGMSDTEISKHVALSIKQVGVIIKDPKTGTRKRGTKKGAGGQGKKKAFAPSAFLGACKKLRFTLASSKATKEILDHVYAVGEEKSEPDDEAISLISEVAKLFTGFSQKVEDFESA